jgi:hypothetical protein
LSPSCSASWRPIGAGGSRGPLEGASSGAAFDTDFHGFLPSLASELGAQWRESYSGELSPRQDTIFVPGPAIQASRGAGLRRDDATRGGGEVARLFNLSPSLIGETLQVNRSTAQTEYEEAHRLCFSPIARDISEQLARQLFTRNQRHRGHWVDFSLEDWLRDTGAPSPMRHQS